MQHQRLTLRLASLLLVTTLPGCASLLGTFAESEPNKVFIGVRTDAHLIANGCPAPSPCLLPRPLAALDLPFSLVTDTVLLLYTVPSSSWSREP